MNKEKNFKVLAINPGSTSTAIAVFQDDREIFHKTIRHSVEELKNFEKLLGFKISTFFI